MNCTGCALCLARQDLNVDTPGRTYTQAVTIAELVGDDRIAQLTGDTDG